MKLDNYYEPFFRYGKIYLKAAKNSMEKGADYAKNEIERLQRILDKVRFMPPILQLKHTL